MIKLPPHQLHCHVAPEALGFESTAELDELTGIVGQPRATQALEFGLSINQPGYNLYIAGEAGTGRIRYVMDYLNPLIRQKQTPSDCLYVNNFDRPQEPRVIHIAPGQGKQLQNAIDHLIDTLLDTFPATFDNPTYQRKKTALQSDFDHLYDEAISSVKRVATSHQIAVYLDQGTVTFTPIINGKVVDESEFANLSEAELDTFRDVVEELEALLNEALLELPQWQRDLNDSFRHLREASIEEAVKPLLQRLIQQYQGNTAINLYLAQVEKHLPKVIEELFNDTASNPEGNASHFRKLLENHYRPNVLTSATQQGAPIVFESNPSYQNLFGRVSYDTQDSGTAYQQIAPGALHHANGGYLVVDIEKLIAGDNTWPALKRALRDGYICAEPQPGEIQIGGTTPLRPEPVPLNIKVILIGSREIYYALNDVDREFNELFRVFVDFESRFDNNDKNLREFASLLHSRSQEANIAELSASAVARLVEYAHRMAEHQTRLSARIDAIMDLAIEADHQRLRGGHELIDLEHIHAAIEARQQRNGRLRDRLLDEILDGTLVISSSGKAVGQINGLSILEVGEMAFGSPTRITATVHPGHRGVVDIERETKLGQPVHSKGVMILTGYLCSFYAQEFPLAISAHIAMEQSYGYIDGDSAALAELCALLSALIGQPLRQDLAVTGSINQRGEIQAVGGINEKIEAFFDVCEARGLNSQQGVIIPASNQANLMLAQRVIDAVEQQQFSVYTVDSVNDALALLTGKDPGEPNAKHKFPKGTFNDRISKRLHHFATLTQHGGH